MTCLTSLLPPGEVGGGGRGGGGGAVRRARSECSSPCWPDVALLCCLALSFSLTHAHAHAHAHTHTHTNSPSPSLYACLPPLFHSGNDPAKGGGLPGQASGRLLLFFFYHSVPRPEASASCPMGIRRLNGRSQSAQPEIFAADCGQDVVWAL